MIKSIINPTKKRIRTEVSNPGPGVLLRFTTSLIHKNFFNLVMTRFIVNNNSVAFMGINSINEDNLI
jgi:hypothetical protein